MTTTARRIGADRPLPASILHYIGGVRTRAWMARRSPSTTLSRISIYADLAAGGPADVDRAVRVWR